MTEYISKEQSVEVVNTAFEHIYDSDSTTVCLVDLQNEIIMAIEQHTEPANVAPVVHARWVNKTEKTHVFRVLACSNCGALSGSPFFDEVSNYCSNCGARMDGEKE